MSVKQTVYFMALVGAMAGLACWAIQAWVADLVPTFAGSYFTILDKAILGALIGGLTVGFSDHWSAERVVVRWLAMGVLLGAIAGVVGGVLYVPILSVMTANPTSFFATFGRPLLWLIAGGLIGLATGLRWAGVNRLRSVHAMLGGVVGGVLGGVVFTFLGSRGEILQAVAYMLSGMGITLGVTLAPVLLRDGVLFFISSADPRAQNKYGSPHQEWIVQEGDRFVVGSQGSERNMTIYARAVDVYIPDALIAKRHAVLFAKGKRFYIQQHPENVGPQGQPVATLQLNGTNVTGTRELRDSDEIIMGQTLLRFYSRKQAAVAPGGPVGRRV
jgi:FHA domain-containing protein